MQRLTTWRMKKDGIKVGVILDYDQTEYNEHIIIIRIATSTGNTSF